MNLPASPAGLPRRNRSFRDPLAYYHQHYAGLRRGELQQRDSGLYERLRRDGLLQGIPGRGKRAFPDPLAYYREHYAGLTREELHWRDPALANRLRRDGLLERIPKLRRDGLLERIPKQAPSFGSDPLAYYRANYPGLRRCELKVRDRVLYEPCAATA